MASDSATLFSLDHSSTRQRFRQAASHLGWQLESYPIGLVGPDGDELAFDVACSQSGDRFPYPVFQRIIRYCFGAPRWR